MRLAPWIVALAGCYSPSAAPGIPCSSAFTCPGDQICDRTQQPPVCGTSPSAIDAPGSDAPPLAPDAPSLWSPPIRVPNVLGLDDDPSLTADELELYYNRNDKLLYAAKRATVTDAWGISVELIAVESPAGETTPEISADGLTLYFGSSRAAGPGNGDLWVSTRPSLGVSWSPPQLIPQLSTPDYEAHPWVTADQRTMLLNVGSAPTFEGHIAISTRAAIGQPWTPPTVIASLDAPGVAESNAVMPADGLTIYFDRGGKLFTATRASTSSDWIAPHVIDELQSIGINSDPWISPDGHRLYFSSTRDGARHLWQTSR